MGKSVTLNKLKAVFKRRLFLKTFDFPQLQSIYPKFRHVFRTGNHRGYWILQRASASTRQRERERSWTAEGWQSRGSVGVVVEWSEILERSAVAECVLILHTHITLQHHYKKLSCRRESAQRSVSLKLLLSLKVAQGHSKLHRKQAMCKFLLVYHCNHVSVLHCFSDI